MRALPGLHRRVAGPGRDRRRGAGDHLGAAAGPAAGGSVVRAAWVPVAALAAVLLLRMMGVI